MPHLRLINRYRFNLFPFVPIFSWFLLQLWIVRGLHYNDVIMGAMASQITSVTIAYSIVCSSPDQRKHRSSASLAVVRGIHRGPMNSSHKGPVTQKMFPLNDVMMILMNPPPPPPPDTVRYFNARNSFWNYRLWCHSQMDQWVILCCCWLSFPQDNEKRLNSIINI